MINKEGCNPPDKPQLSYSIFDSRGEKVFRFWNFDNGSNGKAGLYCIGMLAASEDDKD